MTRHAHTFLIAVTLAVIAACAPATKLALDAAFAGMDVAVSRLERMGKIDAETARELRIDLPDGKKVAVNLVADLKAIPKNEARANGRALKLQAWQKAEKEWIAIVNRGHFALSPDVQEWVDLLNDIFQAAIEGYGGASVAGGEKLTGRARVTVTGPASPHDASPRSEKDVERELARKVKELARKVGSW